MKTKKLVCYNCGGRSFITATYESGQTSAICPVCGGIGTHDIQMTNADRIRAMSDEELCDLLDEWWCMGANNDERLSYADERLAWLQQPAGEEDKHEPN